MTGREDVIIGGQPAPNITMPRSAKEVNPDHRKSWQVRSIKMLRKRDIGDCIDGDNLAVIDRVT
jgi:hypothetical protein